MSSLEVIATISGIIGVYLQTKEKIIAWPFAILSVAISAYIFFGLRLYSDFGLHVIYIFLNIYGWYVWLSRRGQKEVTPTISLALRGIFISITLTIFGTVTIGYLMNHYTDADLPFFDAFTTSGSLVAQYLLAKKYLQNWLLWIVVDLVAIPMYLYKQIYLIAFLFTVFLGLSIWGYLRWKKEMATNVAIV